jgi:hypothetical protein
MAKYIIVWDKCDGFCDMYMSGTCFHAHTFGKKIDTIGIPEWCKRPGVTKVTLENQGVGVDDRR